MPPSARDILGPEGPLARRLEGYEAREPQLSMADAVERALTQDRRLVCEAGTGTGKTLAYLVPAILSGRTVVVSTATKALQEQIFYRDLPMLEARAGLSTKAALVKGLPNYLCLRRYDELRHSPDALEPDVARSLAAVEAWLERTEKGDLSEIEALTEADPLRQEISSSSETRVGVGCPHHERCFVTRMKREAEQARLLVVNHHLFFADLSLRGPRDAGALPPYEAVIFDEAHQIEDIAADFFGTRISSARVEALLRDAARALVRAGLSDPTPLAWRSVGHKLSLPLAQPGQPSPRDGAVIVGSASMAASRFFSQLVSRLGPEQGRQPLDASGLTAEQTEAYHRFDSAFEALQELCSSRGDTLDAISRRAKQLREDVASIIDGAGKQVTWLEQGGRSISLGSSPVNVSGLLSTRLFDNTGAVVLTSATIATEGGFSFFRARVGLSGESADVEELTLPSPFDYRKNALLYVARDLPDVQDPAFTAQAAARTAELLGYSAGGAFVLCTSVKSMRALHAALSAHKQFHLLVQGDAPKSALLDRFRARRDAVLVATMSFWEGVDVPGRALRLVVIDRLPFPVPTDPVVAARTRALEEAGQNAFMSYHVPTAAITLKQGFGRLIRTTTDRGVVAILDRRISTRSYGQRLLSPLPEVPVTPWVEDVEEFFVRERYG